MKQKGMKWVLVLDHEDMYVFDTKEEAVQFVNEFAKDTGYTIECESESIDGTLYFELQDTDRDGDVVTVNMDIYQVAHMGK